MTVVVISFIAGLAAWTFLEYLIHGWLSHTFHSFASVRHQVHHSDPRRVFTIRAWIPAAVIWIAGLAIWGLAPGMVFYTGMATGFVTYEIIHYRVHFRIPHNRLEAYLREHHLVHHYRAPNRCFGVTNGLWDWIFSSDIDREEMRSLRSSVRHMPALSGPTNVRLLFRFVGLSR